MKEKPEKFKWTCSTWGQAVAFSLVFFGLIGCGKNQDKARTPTPIPINSSVYQSPTKVVLTSQKRVRLARLKFDDTLEVPVRMELDERRSTLIVTPVAGRLEEVFVRSTDQVIAAGEPVASIYSPELVTAQREFLLLGEKKNDGLEGEAASRLLQMGMTSGQIKSILKSGKPISRISIAVPKSGFIVSTRARSPQGSMNGPANQASGGGEVMGSSNSGEGMGMSGKSASAIPGSGSGPIALEVGTYLERGSPLATLNDLAIMAASLALPIDKVGWFKEGDSIHIALPALGVSTMARIDYIESTISDTNRTLTAKAYLSNTGLKLKVGTLGKAHLTASLDSTWALPRSAVHSLGEKRIVWVRSGTDSTSYQAREVRIGRRGVRFIEITQGLNQGDEVAETASLLIDRDAVVIPVSLPDTNAIHEDQESHENHEIHQAHDVNDSSAPPVPEKGHQQHSETVPIEAHSAGKSHGEAKATINISKEKAILAGIESAKAEISMIAPATTFRATTRFDERSSERIPTRVDGTVDQVKIRRQGEKVSKGQILAEIRSDALTAAQEEFLLATTQTKNISDQTMANAQVQASRRRLQVLGMADSQIKDLLLNGKSNPRISIISPRTGIILAVNVQSGQYVKEGEPLFTLGAGDPIWIETWMLPDETMSYPEGTDAWVEIEGRPGAPILGKLEHMKQETSISGALAVVHIGIPNPEGKILPGLQAWVTLKKVGKRALAIPPSALLESSASTMAWIQISPNTYTPRMVKVGLRTPEAVEILDGIRPEELVVVSGAYLLNSEWIIRQGAGKGHSGH